MAVITISRQFGAGGITLGQQLAERLGYHYVDKALVGEVAKQLNVSPGAVRGFEKEGGTNLMKYFDRLVSQDYMQRLLSGEYGYLNEKSYVDSVKAIVEELYKQGNVVIIGRESQYILKDKPDVYHLLLVKDLEERVRFIEEKYQRKEDARKIVARADKNRQGMLRFFSDCGLQDDPLSYHLTINMTWVSMEKAMELVLSLVST